MNMKFNGVTGINSYKLAQFVNNYVIQVQDRQDLQENLGSVDRIERTILSGGATDEQTKTSGIRSRTAWRWLKRLGYNWQDVKKGVFLDGHERDDVVEYCQNAMRSSLSSSSSPEKQAIFDGFQHFPPVLLPTLDSLANACLLPGLPFDLFSDMFPKLRFWLRVGVYLEVLAADSKRNLLVIV
jgi:hypothetical protein